MFGEILEYIASRKDASENVRELRILLGNMEKLACRSTCPLCHQAIDFQSSELALAKAMLQQNEAILLQSAPTQVQLDQKHRMEATQIREFDMRAKDFYTSHKRWFSTAKKTLQKPLGLNPNEVLLWNRAIELYCDDNEDLMFD